MCTNCQTFREPALMRRKYIDKELESKRLQDFVDSFTRFLCARDVNDFYNAATFNDMYIDGFTD